MYEAGGRQFVVIAAGGGKNPKASPGGSYIAFALPEDEADKRFRTSFKTFNLNMV